MKRVGLIKVHACTWLPETDLSTLGTALPLCPGAAPTSSLRGKMTHRIISSLTWALYTVNKFTKIFTHLLLLMLVPNQEGGN